MAKHTKVKIRGGPIRAWAPLRGSLMYEEMHLVGSKCHYLVRVVRIRGAFQSKSVTEQITDRTAINLRKCH